MTPDKLLSRAEASLRAAGWQILRTADPAEATRYVAGLVNPDDTVVTHTSRHLNALGLANALRGKGVRVEEYGPDRPAESRAALLAAAVGITGATAVVAETGTVILAEEDGHGRLVSNLPYSHVVVAPVYKLVPSLDDGLAAARRYARQVLGRPIPRYVSGISGPSKTGDIEFVIVPGMHGPGKVHIILLESEPGDEPESDLLMP